MKQISSAFTSGICSKCNNENPHIYNEPEGNICCFCLLLRAEPTLKDIARQIIELTQQQKAFQDEIELLRMWLLKLSQQFFSQDYDGLQDSMQKVANHLIAIDWQSKLEKQ